jgi:S1-C subfamily serine protease
VIISYVNSKNVWDLEKISFQELSREIQEYYGYDPKNPTGSEERQRQRRDYNKAILDRQWEAERPIREAELRKKEKDQAAQRKYFENIKTKADDGDLEAMVQLAQYYSLGIGVAKDSAEAVKWYRMAAERGDELSQVNLGVHYSNGEGVPQDKQEAGIWYLRAARQGDHHAQMYIGEMHVSGDGARQDFIEAYKWFNIATIPEKSDSGSASKEVEEFLRRLAQDQTKEARRERDNLVQWMTPDQIAEGQRRAATFKPRKERDRGPSNSPSEKGDSQLLASGTGFIISADGFLVTNEHVVRDGAQVRLVTSAGLISAKVVKVDAANDLALLKAEGRFAALPVAASRGVKLGGTVATVGFPNIGLQGFAPKLAKGEIASLSGAADDARYFQISVPVQPGNSGGALVDERGNVVGVVSAKLNAAAALKTSGALPENVNYAVKSSYLLSFLESVPEVSAKLKEPETKERKFEEVVKSAEQAAVLVLVY